MEGGKINVLVGETNQWLHIVLANKEIKIQLSACKWLHQRESDFCPLWRTHSL